MVAFGGTSVHRRNVQLTVNQGAKDDTIITAQSSDVAHGLTSGAVNALDTDDYYTMSKSAPTGGGISEVVASDVSGHQVIAVRSVYGRGALNTTKTTAARAMIEEYGSLHDGANALADLTADGNLWGVRGRVGGADVMRVMVDEDGDFYSVTAAQTFDTEDDDALVDMYDRVRSGQGTDAERSELERVGIIVPDSVDEEGNAHPGLTNQSQLGRLITGTLRKHAARLDALEALPPADKTT